MQVHVAFRHMDPSVAVQKYASDKLEHVISKYVSGENVDSHVTFSLERFWHVATFTININGLTVKSSEKTEDMYSSIDLALDKIENQVRRYRTKIRSHRPDARHRSFTMQVVAAPRVEEGDDVATDSVATPAVAQADNNGAGTNGAGTNGAAAPAAEPIKTEQYTAPFMGLQEAIMQLELRHAQFFVFTNEETERLNIVHRRDDGNFGLIDAEASHH